MDMAGVSVYLLPRPSPWRRPSYHSYHTCCQGSFCPHPGRHATTHRPQKHQTSGQKKQQQQQKDTLQVDESKCFQNPMF